MTEPVARAVPEAGTGTGTGAAQRVERRARHQAFSRTQLLDAAEATFGRKGFHETTLKEVAEQAGFSVGSVYSFFTNKDDLFRQVYVRRGEEFMPGLRAVITAPGPALEVLQAVVTFQVGFFRAHPHFGRLYLFHSGPLFDSGATPAFDPVILENFAEALQMQAELFVRGHREGGLRAGDPEVLARLLSGLVAAYQEMDPAVVSDAPEPGERLPLSDLHDLVARAFGP